MSVIETINIEVAYATPEKQVIEAINIDAGSIAEAAIIQSGLLEKFPAIDLDENKIGVFGKVIKKDAILKDGDRIEIYRPLIADPKEVRRQRAKEGKVMKKGGGTAEEKET